MPHGQRLAGTPWWLSPHGVGVGLAMPLLLLAYVVPADFHQQLGRPVKYMDLPMFMLGTSGLVSFALGTLIGRTVGSSPALPDGQIPPVATPIIHASWLALGVTLPAYLLYLWPVFRHPELLLSVLSAQPGATYVAVAAAERVPGVTSLTQAGVLYVVLWAIRCKHIPAARAGKIELALFGLLVAFALARSAAYSERKAILELLVPVAVIYARGTRPTLVSSVVIPLAAVVSVFAVFALLEFTRSWVSHYRELSQSGFGSFAAYRFIGYYVTALDNGAGIIKYSGGAIGPIFTFAWLWRFPIEFGQGRLVDSSFADVRYRGFLHGYASAEYNNPSGLFIPFLDYGIFGGMLAWLVVGLAMGHLYRAYKVGALSGLMLYPIFFGAIVEIPRVFEFSSPRIFPAIAGAIALIIWLKVSGVPVSALSLSTKPGRRYR